MPLGILASSYLSELRLVRHRLAELMADEAGSLALYAHSETIQWMYQVLDDMIREVESGSLKLLHSEE